MTPERFQRIEELYHAAREGTAEERAALLAQTDPELRREIESLLAYHTGGELLDQPAMQNSAEPLDDSLPACSLREISSAHTGLRANLARGAWARFFGQWTRD